MQCPNCRKIEKGQWLYANGLRSNPEFSVDDLTHDDDIYDLSFSEMVMKQHCYTNSLHIVSGFMPYLNDFLLPYLWFHHPFY